MKKIFFLFTIPLVFILNANAQSAATIFFNETNGNLPAVGTNFDVPVNVTGFDVGSMPAGIIVITILIEYDSAALDYTGYENSISGLDYIVVSQSDTMIRVEVFDWTGGPVFNVANGKLIDLQFNYLGGHSTLVFSEGNNSPSEYGDPYFESFPIPTLTNGAIEGYFENTISGGDWHTASDWTLNRVPTKWHNVTVSSGTSATASTDAICHKLKVEAGGTLIVSDTLNINLDD